MVGVRCSLGRQPGSCAALGGLECACCAVLCCVMHGQLHGQLHGLSPPVGISFPPLTAHLAPSCPAACTPAHRSLRQLKKAIKEKLAEREAEDGAAASEGEAGEEEEWEGEEGHYDEVRAGPLCLPFSLPTSPSV